MTVTSRIDALARGLAVRSAADEPLERIARAMATPISRRRAFRLAAAAAGTSMFALRTGTAHACATCPKTNGAQELTQFCGYAVGVGCKYVCCDPRDECCTAPGNVLCCRPYEGEGCGPIVNNLATCECKNPCQDDCCRPEQECIQTSPDDAPEGFEGFCKERCKPGHVRCGYGQQYQCCPANAPCCGYGCCNPGDTCCRGDDNNALGRDGDCCGPGYFCTTPFDRGVCRCHFFLECQGGCCPLGQICVENDKIRGFSECKGPPWEDLEDLFHALGGALDGGGAADGASASASRTLPVRPAAAQGAAGALVAIDAVANLGALAFERLRQGRPASGYRRRVKVPRPRLAPLAPGPGLGASAADALHRLLSAEARGWALVNAASIAQGRSLGALRAGNVEAARRQARSFGQFKGQAAKAFRRVPALRAAVVAALQAAGTPEVTVTESQVRAYQDTVRRSGLPADMRARLRQLGLGRADQRRVAKIVVARSPRVGPALIAPLADTSRVTNIVRLSKLLKTSAERSRRRPLVSSKKRPRTVRGTRPHASQASGHRRRRG